MMYVILGMGAAILVPITAVVLFLFGLSGVARLLAKAEADINKTTEED